LEQFLNLGFKAMVVVVNEKFLGKRYLGRILDNDLIEEFKKIGIDPSGENGEYHTVVLDGPIFEYEVKVKRHKILYNQGYYFQTIQLINSV
ncbi:MAG: hypothetical protein K9K32_07275, partial [Halanaerobiales bacterium]|nr:hypothetical protein [Halanaerobiales bacterium]